MAEPQRIGQQLGNYRLTRLLGTGGFAEVYLGEHVHLGTEAAIKVLHTRLELEDAEAFRIEARTIARLKHAHIVRVLDFGIEGTLPYLVMDYAPHGSLRSRHTRGTQLPLPVALSYVQHVGSALQFAHDQKLIHRDLKPENILVDEHDNLVLSDFGIATMAQTSRSQNTQDIVGTAAYMAPEQLQGKPRQASDQYSLAIMTYEWLTGTRPFQGTFTEIASQHLLMPPPPLREKRPDLPLVIEQVLMTALAKDPHQRFASVKAFVTTFEQACEQGLRGANEHNVRTELAPTRPPSNPLPRPASNPLPLTMPVQSAYPVNTPPGVWPGNQPQPVNLARPIATPRSSSSSITPRPVAPGKRASGKRRKTRIALIVSALLLVVLIASSLVIYWSLNQPFHQQITVGADITSISVGTNYDSAQGQTMNQASTFHVGDTIYMVCHILATDLNSANSSSIAYALSSPVGVHPQVSSGSFDLVQDVYYISVKVTVTGDYAWQLSYNSQPEASITFQVV